MAPQAKRRKVASAVEEINFDPAARQDYLTGFHKRKLQRIKLAQEHAQERAREERREGRRKIREQRAAEIQQAIEESRKMLEQVRGDSSSSGSDSEHEEWEGFEDPLPVDYEKEYIDEDKYTTVTVEELGLSKDALHSQEHVSSPDDDKDKKERDVAEDKAEGKASRKPNNQKKKKKQFRYESKEERKATRMKERTGGRRKASARRER